MTAVITDMAEYLARKGRPVQDAAATIALSGLSDARIRTRHALLKALKETNGDATGDDLRFVFPKGFDPVKHAEDNIDTVYQEGVRRGVFVTSA